MNANLPPFAAITMYCGEIPNCLTAWMDVTLIAPNIIELRTSVGGQPPLIERGGFAAMMAKSDAWYENRIKEGFQPPFNSEYRSYKN